MLSTRVLSFSLKGHRHLFLKYHPVPTLSSAWPLLKGLSLWPTMTPIALMGQISVSMSVFNLYPKSSVSHVPFFYSIQVENIRFRVHRYFFERESVYFSRKLAIPASPGKPPKGSQDDNAIILPDLTPEQFATFLWVFYNP